MKGRLLVVLACAALALVAQSAASRITVPAAASRTDPEQATRNAVRSAYEQYQGGEYERALVEFSAAIESVGFSRLPSEQRHGVLFLAGEAALKRSEWVAAQRYFTRASGLSEADSDDWHQRLRASWALDDVPDSALCLATIAQRWPDTLQNVNVNAIYSLAHKLHTNVKLAATQQGLLQALFDAQWLDHGNQPNGMWVDLTRLLLTQKKIEAARKVAARINGTRALLAMQIDRRFDPVTRGRPLDIDRSSREELARVRLHVEQEPEILQRVIDLQYLQMSALQFSEVLAADDLIIASVGEGDTSSDYSDFYDTYVWILDNRARALRGLGRWDEALQQRRRAARRPERGQLNVSQALNLGELYVYSGRPDEAIDAVSDLGSTSAYGRIVRANVLALAAVQHEDEAQLATQLRYLREHRRDGMGSYQEVLLLAGDMEAAEAVLI